MRVANRWPDPNPFVNAVPWLHAMPGGGGVEAIGTPTDRGLGSLTPQGTVCYALTGLNLR